MPVVNAGGRCVGIITEADLVMAGEDDDLHLPHYFELFGGLVFLESLGHFEERLRKATAALASDLMTEDPVTIEPSASVHEAARLISRSKHNRLPVVEHGRLVGVVTRVDVLEALTAGVAMRAGAGPDRPRRDRAQLRAAGARRRAGASCARSSRPTATGTARCRPRARRWPAGATWLAVATADEAAALRAARDRAGRCSSWARCRRRS